MVRIKRNGLIYCDISLMDDVKTCLVLLKQYRYCNGNLMFFFGTIVDLRVILYRVIYSSTLPVSTRPLQHLTRQSKADQDFGSNFEGNSEFEIIGSWWLDLVNRGHVFSNRRQSRLSSLSYQYIHTRRPNTTQKKIIHSHLFFPNYTCTRGIGACCGIS